MAARCREIAAQFGSAHVGMNSNYFASDSKFIDFVTIFGISALVLAGGYVVIQSIFRVSVNDKIQSYGQLCTIGATSRQLRSIVKKESRRLGGIGILLLVVSSVVLTRSPEQAARLFFPDGDIKIYLSSEQPEEEIIAAGNPLDENLRQEILSVDGVVDIHSILLSTGYQKHHADMDVGAAMELTLGQKTVTVTISGLFDASKAANGHGALAMDTIGTHIEYEKMQSSIIFGSLQALSMAVCAEVSKKSFAGAVVPYQFPFLQMGLFLLVLFGMEVILSVWMVRRQKKQSLVEQMRVQS